MQLIDASWTQLYITTVMLFALICRIVKIKMKCNDFTHFKNLIGQIMEMDSLQWSILIFNEKFNHRHLHIYLHICAIPCRKKIVIFYMPQYLFIQKLVEFKLNVGNLQRVHRQHPQFEMWSPPVYIKSLPNHHLWIFKY